METKIKNLIYASHYMKGHETNINDDYIECNEVYGLLLKAKDIGYEQAIEDTKRNNVEDTALGVQLPKWPDDTVDIRVTYVPTKYGAKRTITLNSQEVKDAKRAGFVWSLLTWATKDLYNMYSGKPSIEI